MTQLTFRQEKILNTIIKEYVVSAWPVSSKFLEEKHHLGICPATIRIEMQKLTDAGFISQPHTSAGRVPTDKGYRFFVDRLFEKELAIHDFNRQMKEWLQGEINNSVKFLQLITKNLSLFSSNLVLGCLLDEKILWKEGWGEIIKEPEFSEKKVIDSFIRTIEALEADLEKSSLLSAMNSSVIKVFIGRENPFAGAREFSIIAGRCHFSEEEGILAILGPKRMDYNRNISSLNSLIQQLENESFSRCL